MHSFGFTAELKRRNTHCSCIYTYPKSFHTCTASSLYQILPLEREHLLNWWTHVDIIGTQSSWFASGFTIAVAQSMGLNTCGHHFCRQKVREGLARKFVSNLCIINWSVWEWNFQSISMLVSSLMSLLNTLLDMASRLDSTGHFISPFCFIHDRLGFQDIIAESCSPFQTLAPSKCSVFLSHHWTQ